MEVLSSMDREGRSSSSPLNNSNTTNTSKTDTLKVYVRVRPLNAKEREVVRTTNLSWQINGNQITQCHAGKPLAYCSYAFDRIFTPEDNNKIVFEEAASSVVDSVVDGYNGTIFAYGQTSSGKTHTMLGSPEDRGIIPLSIYQVFERLEKREEREFLLRVSYIEIYNENIRDLLAPQNENLKVHEDFNGRVYVDAKEEIVDSPETVLEIMKKGENNRTIGSTNMNERSSRSHTIFTLFIESREKDRDVENDGLSVRASTLTLVDLAGSERVSQTGAEGSRLKEGMHINKSLLTLGTVINKLCEGINSHIPYRDSKLTRILQPALGGNSKTTVICAITPASMHIEETHSTLKFASRAKKVKINAHCNEILDDKAMLSNYRKEIEMLRHQLTELQQDREGTSSCVAGQDYAQINVSNETVFSLVDSSAARKRTNDNSASDQHLSKLRKFSTHHCVVSTDSAPKNSIVSYIHFSVDTADDMESYVYSLEDSLREKETERVQLHKQLGQVSKSLQSLEMESILYKKRCNELYENFCFQVSQDVVYDVVNNVVDNELGRTFHLKTKLLEQCIGTQNDKLFELHQQKEELESRIQLLDVELSKKASQLETYHTAMLPSGNQSILKENDSLKQKVSELESKIRSSKVLHSQTASEKQQLGRELKNLQKQLRKLEAENVKLKESSSKQKESSLQMSSLENKVDTLNKDRDKILEELQYVEKEKNNLILENKSLLTKLEETIGQTENLQKELEQTREESSKLSAQNGVLQEENDQMRHKILSLEETLKETCASNEKSTRNAEELEQKLQLLESSYKELQSSQEEERMEFEKERNSYYEQLTETHLQLEQSKAAIEELHVLLSDEQQKSDEYAMELKEQKEAYQKDKEVWDRMLQDKESEIQRILFTNSELETKLESSENKRCYSEGEVTDSSHTIVFLKERLEHVWKEKLQLSLELDLSKELLEHYKVSHCTTVSALTVDSSEIISLHPIEVEADDQNSFWKQEFERTNQELGKSYKEKKKLLETIHQRDLKIEHLETSYRNLVEDNGLICKLKQKLERRDIDLKRVNEELRKVEELAVVACKGTSFEEGRQLAHLQAENHALQEHVANLNKHVENLQNERQQLLEESSRLRKEIKKRDIHRIDLEEKFCLWKQQLCQESQNWRTKRKPPRPPLRVISNETQ